MCGGELMKENGVFICQNCGCKYSTKEAKKMLLDTTDSKANVSTQAQFDNLVKLAKTAFESNNFAEAEKQSNLALAINAADFDIYFIKARAIISQANTEKSRLREAVNCFISAFEILDDKIKEQKKNDIFDEIVSSINGEIKFWVELVEKNRPSKKTANDAMGVLIDSIELIEIAGTKMNIDCSGTKETIINSFIDDVNTMTLSAWKTTVAYNYYRDSLYDYGKHRKTHGQDITYEYRPTEAEYNLFNNEVNALILIMEYAVNIKNDKTDYHTLAVLYCNMAIFLENQKNCLSYKKYCHYDNFGTYYEYREPSLCRTGSTISNFNARIMKCCDLVNKFVNLDKQKKLDLELEKQAKEKEQAKVRFEAYWKEHKEERLKLENEKNELNEQIKALNLEISKVPGKEIIDELNEKIKELRFEKKRLGIFKIKEKKAIQDEIDSKVLKMYSTKKKVDDEINAIKEKVSPLNSRISQINNELTKGR